MLQQPAKLKGVAPVLVAVVQRAAESFDFRVLEGLRTKERQAELVAAGASWTMNSRHLTGHAVDLGVLVAGEVRWDWPLYFKLAAAVQRAAIDLKTPIRWGGSWSLLNSGQTPERLQAAYIAAQKAAKKRVALDGPHFEIPR